MRGIYAIIGVGVLGTCLAGWAALAWAEPSDKTTPPETPAVEAKPIEPAAPPASPAEPTPAAPVPPPPPANPMPDVPDSPPPPPAVPPWEPKLPELPAPPSGEGPATPAPVPPRPEPVRTTLPPPAVEPPVTSLPDPVSLPVAAPKGEEPRKTDAPRVDPPDREPPPPKEVRPSPVAGSETAPAPEDRKDEPMAPTDGAGGRQEPAVCLEWSGPPAAKVGQPGDYTLAVRNICPIPVQQVIVRVRIPQGLSADGVEPRAIAEKDVLVWELGTLQPRQEKALRMKLVAQAKGDLAPQAWVTFTGSSILRIRVREPKLLLKASAPERVLVGDPAAFTLTVSNPGDGSADGVKIRAALSEGLEHSRGNKVDFEIGNLAAGESRNVTLICATRTGGVQKCEGVAETEGGLRASDVAGVNVITPRLDLHLAGPALRYLDRKALYTLRVTNPGDAPATNVTVGDVVPAGFKVLAASDGGRHDFATRTVSWFLGEIGPGQTREVKLEVQAITPGEHKHRATVVGARGLRSESELLTRVEGLSALLLEVVDTDDPIEVGGDTAYEVRVTNTGSKTETDIKLVATVPDKMEFKSAQGPARYREEGKAIVFEPLAKLDPRAEAVFRVNVKALEAGTVRFKIQMTSATLQEPVIKMEATRIYADTPDGK
jgi:uncharacterized repeat protein (TIGR01451 family)